MKNKTFIIIGRPNVGKSMLYNRLVGSRDAVTADEAGTTRDRKVGTCHWQNKSIIVIDTGGFAFAKKTTDIFQKYISEQINFGLKEATGIFFVVDGKSEILAEDYEIVKNLRKIKKPIYLIINKIDKTQDEGFAIKFLRLGFKRYYSVSAVTGRGIGDLLDDIVTPQQFQLTDDESLAPKIKVAIVGRPNVGKSSLINKILGQERVIVSDIPGTTRDSIDVSFNYKKKSIILTDTAGIRKRGKIKFGAEKFGVERAKNNIYHSDKIILVVDANEGLTRGDAHIAELAVNFSKPLLIAFNKCDLIGDKEIKDLYRFAFLQKSPALQISTKTGKNITDILDWSIGDKIS